VVNCDNTSRLPSKHTCLIFVIVIPIIINHLRHT
jgi:hypothetical protein